MRRVSAMAAAVLVVLASTGCEPKMTITAKPDRAVDSCGVMMHVEGTVTPASATAKVVLQQTTDGKWVDVKGWASHEAAYVTTPNQRAATVSKTTGKYSIAYFVDWLGVKHLRVRSAGSGAVSNDFYIKTTGTEYC